MKNMNTPVLVRAARAITLAPGREIISDAAVIHDGFTIIEVGSYSDLCKKFSGETTDLGDVTITPGLVNAHVHLEMCHLHEKLVYGQGFLTWIRSMLAQPLYDVDQDRVKTELAAMKKAGVVFVSDISTRNAKLMAGLLEESGLFFVVNAETIGFSEPGPNQIFIPKGEFENGHLAASGHAPYSTSISRLQGAKKASNDRGFTFCLHLAENNEELEILNTGGGEFARLLAKNGIPMDDFDPPGIDPVPYAHKHGLLDHMTLAVHCVKISQEDIGILEKTRTNVCLCPRSNEFIGEGLAPWDMLFNSDINICLATDGLCSNADLNPWNELKFMKERYDGPLDIAMGTAMISRNPAMALGVGRRFGTLEPGKHAGYSVLPADVEELFDE